MICFLCDRPIVQGEPVMFVSGCDHAEHVETVHLRPCGEAILSLVIQTGTPASLVPATPYADPEMN